MARIKNPVSLIGGARNLQDKSVTPTAAGFTVQADNGYDALRSVTVAGDADLVAGNIKKDVVIFGITGTYEGAGGESPTLRAVSISRSGNTIYISNPSSNGTFVTGYKIYNSGALVDTQTSTSISLSGLTKGKYSVTVKAYASGFNDSSASNAIAVTVYEFFKNLKNAGISATLSKTTDGSTVSFTLAAASGYYLPTAIDIHCNGESLTYSYNPYTGVVSISALKTTYSGSETYKLFEPTLTLSGDTLTVSDAKLASTIEVYDGNTKAAEESVTPELADTTEVIIIDAEGLATPKLIAPSITINGATVTAVDSVNGSGDVVNATSYDVYDGDNYAGNIAI